jgi:hypothetical protein
MTQSGTTAKPKPQSSGHRKSTWQQKDTSFARESHCAYSSRSLTPADPTRPLCPHSASPHSRPQKDPLIPTTVGVTPPGPTLLPGPSETPWCPSDPVIPVGTSITSPSVALCHSSVTTAGTNTERRPGALAAPPRTSLVKAKKSMGWSHQTLKQSRIVRVCCVVADNLGRAWCYVSSLFFTLTNLTLHLHASITHAFHLHRLRMIFLHVSPLCFTSDTSFTRVSVRQTAVPLPVFKDP